MFLLGHMLVVSNTSRKQQVLTKYLYGCHRYGVGRDEITTIEEDEKMKELKEERKALFSTIVAGGLIAVQLVSFALQHPLTKSIS